MAPPTPGVTLHSHQAVVRKLAALAAPTTAMERKQVVVYEVQDQRSSLTAVKELISQADGTPFKITWLADETLVVFRQSSIGGGCVPPSPLRCRLAATAARLRAGCF